MFKWWISPLLLFTLLLSAPLRAEDAFHRAYSQALQLYQQKDFAAALTGFEAAYAQRPLPRLLINIGRCHHRLGHPEQALQHYERFLREDRSMDPALGADVRRYIDEARAITPPTAPAPALRATPPPPPPSSPPGRRRWPIVLGVVGGALLVGAVVTGAVLGAQAARDPSVPVLPALRF